jgi:endoglucanase
MSFDRRRPGLPRAPLPVVLSAVLAVLVLALTACGSSHRTSPGSTGTDKTAASPSVRAKASVAPPDPDAPAIAAARSFLTTYVDADGRVVRHDQGGDTVSEGEGYAMLLAVAIGDRATFTSVWTWTQTNLEQPSGLFAYHWVNGQVADSTPASDADEQIAWALSMAGTRFAQPAWTDAAQRIALAIAADEIGYDASGTPVLAAGPWALGTDQPTTTAPGYWTPPAIAALAALTGDGRWESLEAADRARLAALSDHGTRLAPDWAQVGTSITAVAAPDGSSPVQAGPDGLRAVVWGSCDPADRSTLAEWWTLMSGTAADAPLSRTLTGTPADHDEAALSAVAAAAAARAAGQQGVSDQLLDRATTIDATYPTYYGAAWVALGRVLLTTTRLASC